LWSRSCDDIIDIRRMTYSTIDSTYSHMHRVDEHEATSYDQNWYWDHGTPEMYSIIATPPIVVQIIPPPLDVGIFHLINVKTGATLDVTSGVILGIPDDLCWAVKWGAMANLLGKDGPGRDPARAAFCESRYKLGVELAKATPVILHLLYQGQSLTVDSLQALDSYYANWQGGSSSYAAPNSVAVAGHNMIAVYPTPDGAYSITCDLVKKFPVPANDGIQVQVGREQLDMILDYAEHLASFKMAGEEFKATEQQSQNFFNQCMMFNSRLTANSRNVLSMAMTSWKQSVTHPRTTPTRGLTEVRNAQA